MLGVEEMLKVVQSVNSMVDCNDCYCEEVYGVDCIDSTQYE